MWKTKINIEHITSVTKHKFSKRKNINWEDKWFFGLLGTPGYYYHGLLLKESDWEDLNLIELKPKEGLWEKPYLRICLSCGEVKLKYFDSDLEMDNWINTTLNNLNLVIINQ